MTPARLLVLVALTALAVGVALVLQRRRPDPPSAPSYRAPAQLDRDDFQPAAGAGSWLIVLFGSTTCDTCPRAWDTIRSVLAEGATSDAGWPDNGRIEARRVDVQTDPTLHKRYRIDGVPTTVIADAEGVVQQSFFGPMAEDQLITALARLGVGPPA